MTLAPLARPRAGAMRVALAGTLAITALTGAGALAAEDRRVELDGGRRREHRHEVRLVGSALADSMAARQAYPPQREDCAGESCDRTVLALRQPPETRRGDLSLRVVSPSSNVGFDVAVFDGAGRRVAWTNGASTHGNLTLGTGGVTSEGPNTAQELVVRSLAPGAYEVLVWVTAGVADATVSLGWLPAARD